MVKKKIDGFSLDRVNIPYDEKKKILEEWEDIIEDGSTILPSLNVLTCRDLETLPKNSIYWIFISSSEQVGDDIIIKYSDKLDWDSLSKNPNLSSYIIDRYNDKVSWKDISIYNKTLNEDLVCKYKKKLEWTFLPLTFPITIAFIEKVKHCINWLMACRYYKLSTDLIEQYKEQIYWYSLSYNLNIDINTLIPKYLEEWNWDVLSRHPHLSKDTILRYREYWNYDNLSLNPSLPLDLIDLFSEILNWSNLSFNRFSFDPEISIEDCGIVKLIKQKRKTIIDSIDIVSDVKKYILSYYI